MFETCNKCGALMTKKQVNHALSFEADKICPRCIKAKYNTNSKPVGLYEPSHAVSHGMEPSVTRNSISQQNKIDDASRDYRARERVIVGLQKKIADPSIDDKTRGKLQAILANEVQQSSSNAISRSGESNIPSPDLPKEIHKLIVGIVLLILFPPISSIVGIIFILQFAAANRKENPPY